MIRAVRCLTLAALLLVPAALAVDYPSELVGFNGPPIDDPATCQEMFRIPEFSPTTLSYILANPEPSSYVNNYAYRASGWQTEGPAGLSVKFTWDDPNDANDPDDPNDSWVRLTTASGTLRPNPALHTEGRVRFKVTNPSEFFQGNIGICLGIRETGILVPQMKDGGSSGPIEWVGVNTTPNGIIAGEDAIVNTTAAGDDIQVVPVGTSILGDPNDPNDDLPLGTAVIEVGPNGVLNTAPAGDDEVRFGYEISATGARRPIPAVWISPFEGTCTFEWNLATGVVTKNGVPSGGGIAGFTGDGDLTAPNNRGTLEQIAIVRDLADPATTIWFTIDELQFIAPEPDPVNPPRVKSPIVNGDPNVVVTDLQNSVDQVTLYRNGVAGAPINVTDANDLTINISPPAVTGQYFQATQTVDGVTSPLSPAVYVLAEPPPYSFSIMVDEGGTGSCNYNTGWEYVGATDLTSNMPQGALLIPDSAVWQTIDVPLDDPLLVQAGIGWAGNGVLGPSPTGFYTIDSLWFTIGPDTDPNYLGQWEVFVDGVEVVEEGVVTQTILAMEDGVNRLPSTRGQSTDLLDSTALSSAASYDGGSSHRLTWTYDDNTPDQSVGVLQRVGSACATSAAVPDTANAIRVHLLCRAPRVNPSVPLPVVQAPIAGNQQVVTVATDPNATSVQLYIDGAPVGSPVAPVAGMATFSGLNLQLDESVSAVQTLPGGVSDFAYPRGVAAPLPPTTGRPIAPSATSVTVSGLLNDANAYASLVRVFAGGQQVGTAAGGVGVTQVAVTTRALLGGEEIYSTQTVNGVESLISNVVIVGAVPLAPAIVTPIQAGDLTVRVSGVATDAILVKVYDGTNVIGSINPAGATTIDVPVSPLVHLHQLTATATNPQGEGAASPVKEVGKGNGNLLICLGYRETNTTAAIGANGGTTGPIEFVGSSTASTPTGRPISPSASWQTLIFDPTDPNTCPIASFNAGNGVLNSTTGKGALEMIALRVDANSPGRSVGTYVIYIDNVVNVGAGPGGTDAVISNFDGLADGVQAMFVQPSFSGTTAANLEATPNSSAVSSEQGNGGKSEKSTWYFKDTAASRWLRLTTFNATNLPNPCVDFTKPLKLDVLLLAVLPPAAPTLNGPLTKGQTSVHVTNVNPNASLLSVYANGTQLIGSLDPNATTVDVPVSPLIHLDSITVKQTVSPGGQSGPSNALEVGKGNGDVLLTLGIRESGDTGPLGSPGTPTGGIEWVGAAATAGGAPQGKPLSVTNGWQTVQFNLGDPNEPILNFYLGDGVITETRGILEHLAVASNSASPNRSSGEYRMFVDNVVNVGAGPGGTDVLITGFESPLQLGQEALFQSPNYSGTTDIHLVPPSNISYVTDYHGHPGQAAMLGWSWIDTSAGRWVRLTTSAADHVPQPIIDLTKPIRMDVLLLTGCTTFLGDVNGDGNSSFADFTAFAPCMQGPNVEASFGCQCADFDGNGRVDLFDFAEFQANYP